MSVLDQYRALSSAPQVTDDAVERAFVTWRTATSTREGMRRVLEQFAASAPAVSGECEGACEYAESVSMPEYRCANGCMRQRYAAPSAVEDAVKAERESEIVIAAADQIIAGVKSQVNHNGWEEPYVRDRFALEVRLAIRARKP